MTENQASDDKKVKATIHSQVPLTLNGTGSLTLTALTKNALEVEDDLKVLGGTYTVKAANHGFKGEGALDIEAATLTIEAGKDGLHAEHDETTELANVTLNPTQLSIAATEDGVDAGNELTIKGGTITVSQIEEGLEARVIRQLGGDVTIKSSDDGSTLRLAPLARPQTQALQARLPKLVPQVIQLTLALLLARPLVIQPPPALPTVRPLPTQQLPVSPTKPTRTRTKHRQHHPLAKPRHKAGSHHKVDKGLAACRQEARKKVTQVYKSSLQVGPSPLMQKATALIPTERSPLVAVA